MKRIVTIYLVFCSTALVACTTSASAADNSLHIGWAQVDITPDRPVALIGQLHKRISTGILDPLTATALALETRGEDGAGEQAIMVSCDVVFTRKAIQERLRALVKNQIPDFDVEKLFLNATHTHTAPGFIDGTFKGLYDVSKDDGVMTAGEYAEFFLERVAQCVARAWKSRKPGGTSWALGHAVVGANRRAHYFDGHTDMYGGTNHPNFSNIEGYADHAVEMLFFWDAEKEMTGVVINIACTAQETENLNEISADFWHDVRLDIRKRLDKDVYILPQCAAAGDQSPHYIFRSRAEKIMAKRRGLSSRQEIARRIADAVEDVLPLAAKNIETRPVFKHRIVRINLPTHEPSTPPFYVTDTVKPVEIHVVRLGDIAVATSPFELFLDYGIRIKARSPAVLTFIVQIACQNGGYLPTAKAIKGGGYSADKFIVGPQGGQQLVNVTLKHINELWK